MEFPGVVVFHLGISKGSNTTSLWNIQVLSFVVYGFSRGKVKKNEKFQGGGFKNVYPQPHPPSSDQKIRRTGVTTQKNSCGISMDLVA